MKKLLFIILLLCSLTLQAQKFDFKVKSQVTHSVDLSVLTAGAAYWVYSTTVEPDKLIHFMYGYFATQAMNYLLEPLDLPKGLKIATPIIVFGGLAMFKEFADSQVEMRDFYAGMIGCGIAVVSFNLTFTIPYKQKLKLR